MTGPVGMWNVVTNLRNAVLDIAGVDEQGNVTGKFQTDPSRTDPIAGTWTAATNELSFSYTEENVVPPFPGPAEERIIRPPGPPVPGWRTTLEYQGYLFQAGKPLFNESPGPTSAAWNMIAGTWTSNPASTPSVNAWTARSQQQLS
jgi:hypothetical protein